MQEKINDLRKAIRYKCWFSALALALTFPDICGKMEYKKDGYSRWFDKYVAEKHYNNSDGNCVVFRGVDCFKLRCAYFHTGNLNLQERDHKSGIDRFELSITSLSHKGLIIESYGEISDGDKNIIEKNIRLDIRKLCKVICDETEKFYIENSEKFHDKYTNKDKQAVIINLDE